MTMVPIERKIIIECDGRILTPEEFTKEVIEANPNTFNDEQKAFLNKFWACATYGL